MKIKILLLLFLPTLALGQPIEAELLGHWDDETITEAFFDNPYHDVWGMVVNDKEYGIISATDGFYFFDLSEQAQNIEPTAFAPGTDVGAGISHRDVKVYQNYVIGVADEGQSALQIFDASVLPDDPVMIYESDEFVRTCHNIYIDEENDRLYLVGGNGFTLRIVSLEDPENPELLASYPNAEYQIPYVHDLYVRDNIAYLNAAGNGLIVGDFTVADAPEMLGSMTSYPQQGYNHSGWLSEDGNYYYLCDETHGMDIKVVDVSDLSDMEVIATMNANSTYNQIPHNVYLQDDLLYVSYYYDGLQVFDVSRPEFPRRVAEYDTYEGENTSYFAGAWGVFVLPSGKSLISDMNNGFYYFAPLELGPNTSVTANTTNFETCVDATYDFSVLVGDGFELEEDINLSVEVSPAGAEATLSSETAEPGQIVDVFFSPLEGGVYTITITATDGTTNASTEITAVVNALPPGPTLATPPNEALLEDLTPFFAWIGGVNALAKKFEISTSLDEFESDIIYSTSIIGNSLSLNFELEEGATYFWRVTTTYECGDSYSETRTFTTESMTAVTEIDGNLLRLYPNPVADRLVLTFDQPLKERLQLEWRNMSGQLLKTALMDRGEQFLDLTVEDLPNGVYLLRMYSENASGTRRIVVQR